MKKVILTLATLAMYAAVNAQVTQLSNGYVGIGQPNPTETFQVGQAVTIHDGGDKIIGINTDPWETGAGLLGAGAYGAEIRLSPSIGKLFLNVSNSANTLPSTSTPGLVITQNQKVGIAKDNPNYTLDINSKNALGLNLKRNVPNGAEGSISLSLENYNTKKWNVSVASNGTFDINSNYSAFPLAANAFQLHENGDAQFGGKNVYLGREGSSTTGEGARLNFMGTTHNTDAVWMTRNNVSNDITQLRVNIGDGLDGGDPNDQFIIGNTNYNNGSFYKRFIVNGAGQVFCEEITVSARTSWPDFVFSPTYNLSSLEETEKFISENKHLPGIPAAAEIEENGLSLGEMQRLQMIKIEELTLHLIELNKQNDNLKNTNAILEKTNSQNQSEIAEIKSLLNQLISK